MNKQIRNLLTLLLLSAFGATTMWAQTYDPTNYSNNLNFMSGYDGYVGTGNQTYKVLNRQYQNGIRSFNYVDGHDSYPTVQFKVPFGTKYLHFHIFGNATGGTYEVLAGGSVVKTDNLPYNSNISSGSNPIVFNSDLTEPYYKIITFAAPLAENTVITIRATSEMYNFTVFAVRYEDPTGKGQSLGKPFSVSEAISLMRNNVKLTETAYVQGYVASQQTSDNPGTFYISDDATHVDELLMNKAKDVNDIQITDEYEVLPRDKVTLACDVPASGLIVTNPKIMLQTKPTYKLYYFDGQNGNGKDMTRGTGNKVNEHTYSVQGMVPDTHYFHVEEYYSGEFFKAYYGQGVTGELTPITWETMEKYNLKESNGSNLTVDTEGDYDIVVNQVEYGPKLTVRGFASPRFYLHSNRAYEPIAELVYNGALFVANDVNMQNGEEFWITKGEQGTVYASATGDHETIDADNYICIQSVAGGTNYIMGATGQFNFQFYMANDGQGANITVEPSSNEWPAPAPVYKLSYNDGSQYEKAFFDNGDGTYTLTDLYLEGAIRFNPIREFNGEREYYGKEGGNLALHRFNSGNLTLSPDGYDYSLFADGPLTFTIVDPNDGTTAPTLTVTGWPEPIFKIQTQNDYVTFTKDADGDSYTAELTVTSSMVNADELFAFDIIDASSSEWAYYGIPSTYYLTRHNSQNVPLGSSEEGHHNISLPMGTYTMTINTDGTLSVEWPEPNYQLAWRENNLSEIVYMPLSYDEETGIWKKSDLTLRQGNQIWVVDANSSRSWGMEPCPECSENLIISKSNSTNIQLTNTGFTTRISGDCLFPMTVTIEEDQNSNNLIMNVLGWSDPGFYLYYYTGWTSAGVSNQFQPDQYLSDTYTLWKELKDVYTEKSYMFTILHVDDSGAWTYYNPTSSDDDLVNLDLNNSQSIPLTPSESATPMFLAEPGNYLFKLMNSPNGTYLTVEAKEKMYSVITNGDVEGSDMSCFFKKEGGGQIVPATYTAGAGKNGTRGIVVQSRDQENSSERWDTGFFIRANQTLPAGTKYRLAFDYKASRDGAGSEAQSHAEPGEYIWYHFPVTPNFMSEWQHFELEGEISQEESPTDNMRTIAILLGVYPEATTFYFDNIVFEIDNSSLEEPMVDIVKNGDVEGEDMSCFFKKEEVVVEGDYTYPIVPAPYTEGAGVNGRGIVVATSDHATAHWDAAFYVRLPQTLTEGTKYRISFDMKSDFEANVVTQVHGEPGEYISYNAFGDLHSYPEWTHYEHKGIISAGQAGTGDNLMRTFAFCLNQNMDEVNHFYFDNIKVEIDEAHVVNEVLMGDVNGDGTVSIQDVVLLVDYTLNKPVSGFVIEAADVTGDGQINVSDVVGIVNIVLKGNSQ